MKKQSKYRAVKTVVDGITFASKLEAKRYGELKLLERSGKISQLIVQPRYPIAVNGYLVCTYVADFRYWDHEQQTTVIEDCKGVATQVYKLKARLLHAALGYTITEIRK